MPNNVCLNISDRSLGSGSGLRQRKIIRLPDGRTLYSIELYGCFEVLILGSKQVPMSNGLYGQSVFIFDKRFDFTYQKNLDLWLTLVDSSLNTCRLNADIAVDGKGKYLGRLRVDASGYTKFGNERIGSTEINRVLTKATMLGFN